MIFGRFTVPLRSLIPVLAAIALFGAGCAPSRPNIGWQFNTPLPSGDQALGPGNDPAAQPAGVLRFSPWFVNDPDANDIRALNFLAPVGWNASGSVVWLHEWRVMAYLQTVVSDPTSGLTIDWLPIQNFIWFEPIAGLPPPPIGGNYQGNAYVPPATDPVQFVADFWMPNVLSHLQGATLVSVDQVPAVAEEFVTQFGGPATAQAFRMRYSYLQDGQPWEEDVSFAWLVTAGNLPTLWYVNFAHSVRAPQGVLDANRGVISTVVASRSTTAEWEGVYRLMNQLFTQRIQNQLDSTAELGRLMQQHREESRALQQQVTEERLASQERIAELRRNTLAGVENLVNPFDQSIVQLPSDWNRYWVNQDGEYVVSDRADFDPNTIEPGVWQILTRQP